MLQETITFDPQASRPAGSRGMPGSATDIANRLLGELREHGLEAALIQGSTGITAGGADLQVWPRELERSEMAAGHFRRRLAALLHEGLPVTLSIRELGPDERGIEILENLCADIRKYLGADKTMLSRIGLSIHSHQVPLQAYLLISRTLLGNGPRYVIMDSLQMQYHKQARVQEETERNWLFLWRQRHLKNALMPAYGAGVRTGCPLLGDEAAEAVLPAHGIQVPVGSAWAPIELNLPRFADDTGHVQWPELETALEAALDLGEQLLEVLSWAAPCQRHDAWLNRRLAIVITGIGELVQSRGNDPTCINCLQWLDRIIARIRKTLWDRSHVIAGQTGVLPALARADPSGGLCDHSHRQDWQRRWRLALASSAVRHRNLLVMSPYSVLPSASASMAAFADLLPVLVHADAYAFAGQVTPGDWKIAEFRRFHTRAWAVMQRRNARSLVAAGV